MPGEPGGAGETGYTGHRVTASIITITIITQKLQHLHTTLVSGQFSAIYTQSSSHTTLKGQLTPSRMAPYRVSVRVAVSCNFTGDPLTVCITTPRGSVRLSTNGRLAR